jgi:deoxycytidylate deaminase/dephospho-CoA kinase
MIVGLTGSFGAGCSILVDYLTQKNYVRYSLSDVVKQALIKERGEDEIAKIPFGARRKIYQDKGDELRKKNLYALVDEILPQVLSDLDSGKDVVIDSIRNHFEVARLRHAIIGVQIIAVNASLSERWERCKAEYETLESAFKDDDERDKGDEQPPYGQHVQKCVEVADFVISNNNPCEHPADWNNLFNKLELFIELANNPGFRTPYVFESSIAQAYLASLSSSCSRRKVGAVICSTSGEIISSGYNHVLNKLRTCAELGGKPDYCERAELLMGTFLKMKYCPQCKRDLDKGRDVILPYKCECGAKLPNDFVPGKMLDLCRALHAEEDAILQAAKMGGITLNNSILYTTTFPCLLCAKK